MAGIGFELKKIFNKKGLFSIFKAYGYTGIVYTGPMILGGLLVLGISFLVAKIGLGKHDRDFLTCLITYTMLASLTVTSFFSMVVTRFVADMIYEDKPEYILPSFWGSSTFMISVGSILYGLFLLFSGISPTQIILCLVLFAELTIVWNGVNYLTAIKDYKSIILSFTIATAVTFISGGLLLWSGFPSITGLLLSICIGYGIMFLWLIILLSRYFPQSKAHEAEAFLFLKWIDKYFSLALIGLFMHIGIFGHIITVWFGPLGGQIHGTFYASQFYDIPVLLAFITILITTINFAIATEVRFYPKYRRYYSLFSEKGTISDIKQAEQEMVDVMNNELKSLAWKQLVVTILAISAGNAFLDILPLGINDLMRGYFRILCVGYGIYAIANIILFMLLYFTDYKGALIASASFAIASPLLTLVSEWFNRIFLGFGFLLGASIFFVIALWRLDHYTKKLTYHTLSMQPMTHTVEEGMFSRLADYLKGAEIINAEK